MSVISRLDQQVDRILIEPLSKARAEQKPQAAAEAESGAMGQGAEDERAAQTGSEPGATGRQRDELPVWLL